VVHLESVSSRTPPPWQGRHSSGDASRAAAIVLRTAAVQTSFPVSHRRLSRHVTACARRRRQSRAVGAKRTYPASTQCEAGGMTALSPVRSVREHRFQMHHCPLQVGGPTYKLAVW